MVVVLKWASGDSSSGSLSLGYRESSLKAALRNYEKRLFCFSASAGLARIVSLSQLWVL